MVENVELIALGREIRRHRKAMGISQEELGGRIGRHRNHIGCLERAERSPSFEMLVDIAKALNVPISALFGEGGK